MQYNIKELKSRIKAKIPNLTESQKIIANYIVENPQKFALSSVRDLEKELNTSKSTIIRLSQALGYDGFQELKNIFLKNIRHELSPFNRFKTFFDENENESDYFKLIAEETMNNITSTLGLNDLEQYNKAINLIKNANQVYFIGNGIATYVAEIASYLFNRVAIRSYSIIPGGTRIAEQLINLKQDDLIFTFSLPPYSEILIQAASYAKEKQLKIISVSDKLTSKIIQYSDVFLQVAVESRTISNSIMALLVLLYSMTEQISHEGKQKTIERIKAVEHVRKEHSSDI